MASSEVIKDNVSIKLHNGTTESGSVKTVSLPLGKLSVTGYSDDGVMELAGLLMPILEKSIASVDHVRTSTLTA